VRKRNFNYKALGKLMMPRELMILKRNMKYKGAFGMKNIFLFISVAVLVLGLAFSAQAVPTIDDPSNGETHLYQIFANPLFNGGSFANSQTIANTVPILQVLPAGNYTVTAYASFAGFSQDTGNYRIDNPDIKGYFNIFGEPFPIPGSSNTISGITPIGIYGGIAIGFFDDNTASGGDIKYTELALNSGGFSQSNGFIFKISPTHYIVAFEDGAGAGSLGDSDYNDLVLNVTTSATPIPGGLLLVGSGLLALVGLRCKNVI
jgi:hypothetical protein